MLTRCILSDMVSESSRSGEMAERSDDSPDMFVDCSPLDEEISSGVKLQIEGIVVFIVFS
jgi:hypothetical protein